MQYGKTKLYNLLSNSPREGWTTQKIRDLIDSLWRDPFDFQRDAQSLGTSVAAQTVFTLPTTGDARGDYPVSAITSILRDDGAVVSIASVDTDARTITASSAPVASSVMTGDWAFYKRVRLDGRPRWTPLGEGAAYETSLRFVEVPA